MNLTKHSLHMGAVVVVHSVNFQAGLFKASPMMTSAMALADPLHV